MRAPINTCRLALRPALVLFLALAGLASLGAETAFPLGTWAYKSITQLDQATPEQLLALGATAKVSGTVTNYALDGINFRFSAAGVLSEITLAIPGRSITGGRDPITMPPLPAWFAAHGLDWNSSFRQMARAMDDSPDFDLTLDSSGGVSLGNFNTQVVANRGRAFYAHMYAVCLANPGVYLNIDFRSPVLQPGRAPVTIDSQASLTSIGFRLPPSPVKARNKLKPRQEPVVLDTDRRFALGLAGILTTQNNSLFEVLETAPLGSGTAKQERDLLQRDWGIHDHDELVAMCRQLASPGIHGLAWREMLALLDADPQATGLQIIDKNHLGNRRASYLLFAAANRQYVDGRGIDAWDQGRSVSLARWGYTAGYLSADEAWAIIMPIWEGVKLGYKSWEDWAYHYIMGRSFWAAGFNQDAPKLSDALISWHKLQFRPDTIWQTAWPAADSLKVEVMSPDGIAWKLDGSAQAWMTMMAAWDNRSAKASLAAQQMDKALALAPDSLMLAINRVNFNLGGDQTTLARDQAKAIVGQWPKDPAAWTCLGTVQNAADLPADAIASWKQALSLDPGWFDALAGYASSLVQSGKALESLAWFDRALARLPAGSQLDDEPNLHYQHAWALNRTGQAALALPIMTELARLIPDNGNIQYQLGVTCLTLGKDYYGKQAMKAFEAAEGLKFVLPDPVKNWMSEWRTANPAPGASPAP